MPVIELNDQNFLSEIQNCRVCVLDFYADWCQPCKPVGTLMDNLAMKYPTIQFFKINVERCPSGASYFYISNLPTVCIMFANECRATIYTEFSKKVEREIKKYV